MRFGLKVAALALFVSCVSTAALAQGAEAPLTNAAVVKLVRAGFSEKTVIAIIRGRPARFDLSAERLIELKKGGVGERVILAMLARMDAAVLEADDAEDEAFFGGGLSGGGGPGAQTSDPGGANIFGSSGGTRGRNRSRGGSGGVDADTQTTGSATVRILRPPAEAGGAPPAKLERTPTLTNDSVVELVEAGFTEGTIVRRIEQSPVEFDLSPAKLDELRKRRVTEPVIAAMRAAMGEDGQKTARP
jgi:hypothetical protein